MSASEFDFDFSGVEKMQVEANLCNGCIGYEDETFRDDRADSFCRAAQRALGSCHARDNNGVPFIFIKESA